jgi:hypothetical protein
VARPAERQRHPVGGRDGLVELDGPQQPAAPAGACSSLGRSRAPPPPSSGVRCRQARSPRAAPSRQWRTPVRANRRERAQAGSRSDQGVRVSAPQRRADRAPTVAAANSCGAAEPSLDESTIDQNLGFAVGDVVLASGHRSGATEERQRRLTRTSGTTAGP